MKLTLIVLAFVLFGGISTAVVLAEQDKPSVDISQFNYDAPVAPVAPSVPDLNELANLVNQERTKAGLQPLVRDADLDASATDKCNDMVAGKYWGHVNAAGVHGYEYIKQRQANKWVSENLAHGYYNSLSVDRGWMNSAPHKAAILDPRYDEVGYAICQVEGYPNSIVQHFSDSI